MYRKQRAFTDKLLFDYYLISSVREEGVYSPYPFYLDRNVFRQMVETTETLNNLVIRLIDKILSDTCSFAIPGFPLRDPILSINSSLLPFFWVRFDAFERAGGGIFFSEFNYDKPCAQREIVISENLNPFNNPNAGFSQRFREGFSFFISQAGKSAESLSVAILVDPNHYEEMHLAHLYVDLLKPLKCRFFIAGPQNFRVKGEKVFVFDQEVNIILRQFPTEFLHEVNDIEDILDLSETGKVLFINDPRAVIGQAKSLFAYLWEMVNQKDSFLTQAEIKTIKETIPYTQYFSPSMVEQLKNEKNKYVIKAIYGRYSEEVYIGVMHTPQEWEETLDYVVNSEKEHIIQEFCPIKKEKTLWFNGSHFEEVEAFANYGIHLTNGQFNGICIRWSDDYLTADDNVWFSPIGVREKSLQIINPPPEKRQQYWEEINERALFEWGYTGGYTGHNESFTLQALTLTAGELDDIKLAAESVAAIIKKTTRFVQQNNDLLCPVLGISDVLKDLVSQQLTEKLTFIGRLDWVIDIQGNLKLLEFNSETPAGLVEAMVLNELVMGKLSDKLANPNKELAQNIRSCFAQILKEYSHVHEIKNVGLISTAYHEDWSNTTILLEIAKDLPYNFILGEVSGLRAENEKLYLSGQALDALYRYYPLDWFVTDPHYTGVLNSLAKNTFSVNPPSTFISQSKAFFALVWELTDKGFYTDEEVNLVRRFIPITTLDKKSIQSKDFVVKPLFGREGEDIRFSYEMPPVSGIAAKDLDSLEDGGCVFQERVNIQSVNLDVHTTIGSSSEVFYPVIGTYVVGDDFAGIYTRAGNRVTDKKAIYLPTFIKG